MTTPFVSVVSESRSLFKDRKNHRVLNTSCQFHSVKESFIWDTNDVRREQNNGQISPCAFEHTSEYLITNTDLMAERIRTCVPHQHDLSMSHVWDSLVFNLTERQYLSSKWVSFRDKLKIWHLLTHARLQSHVHLWKFIIVCQTTQLEHVS